MGGHTGLQALCPTLDPPRAESDLWGALERRELAVYYQPVVSLGTGEVRGFEALLRWRHPERGFIPPAEFIPVAEETGLIHNVGRWALEEACRRMSEWQRQFPQAGEMYVSVNLSARQFDDAGLTGQVEAALGRTGLRPQSLRLEVRESAVARDTEKSFGTLRRLRALGVESSVDDFGACRPSLSSLRRLPASTLKIDRTLIGRMGGAEGLGGFVGATLLLARELGMRVVAEGVETEGQSARLRALSCDYAQGYHFSQAVNAAAVGRMLSESSPRSLQAANSQGLAGLRVLAA